jgi:hypothetical protein
VLATDAERPAVVARVAGIDDVDVINAEDVPEAPEASDGARAPAAGGAGPARLEVQLANLAVRLEMTAVYLKLLRG